MTIHKSNINMTEETNPKIEAAALVVPMEDPESADITSIDYSDMVRGLAKDGHEILRGLDGLTMHLLHMAVGMAGEAGELMKAHLEACCPDKPEYELDAENVLEELGDFAFYLEGWFQGWEHEHGSRIETVYTAKAPAVVDPDTTGLVCMRLAVAASHILDLAKRYAVYGKPLDDKALHQSLIVRTQAVSDVFNTTFRYFRHTYAQVQDANKRKLGTRYLNWRYSDEQAHARRDKDGLLDA